MTFSRTSFFGWLAAAALAVDGLADLPQAWHLWARAVAAVAVALVGYNAADHSGPKSPTGSGPALPLILASVLLVTGCQVAGLGLSVKSPAFGELGVQIGGGSVGHPKPAKAANLLCPLPTPTNALPAANQGP